MEKTRLSRLFTYDHWANRRMREALAVLAPFDPSQPPATLMAHIIAAQEIWLARVQDRTPTVLTAWPELAPEQWLERFHTLNEAWLNLITTWESGFGRVIGYRNTKGHPFETPLHDILLHVIIHGQHHRAQLATMLRQHGHTPPPTDYIFFTREAAPT